MDFNYYKVGPNVVNGHTFTVSDRYSFNDAKILGRGSFGVVTTAIDSESSKVIAIKRIRPYANDDWDARHTLREIRLMRFLGPHPNVISLYNLSLFDEKSELYMMMELMDCDLHRVIQSKQTLTPKHFKCFLKQILEGIRAMHEVGVFHRDLKPGNILVSKDCQIRITDFGLARFMDETTRQGNNKVNPMTEYVVTRWYRAPELLLCPNHPYDEAIDLWSIGCILAELYRRKPLFAGKSHAHQVQLVFEVMGYNPHDQSSLGFDVTAEAVGFLEKRCIYRKQPLTNVVPGLSEDALGLLEELLSVNPRHRPSAVQALRSRYLDDADVICDYSKRYVVKPTASDFEFEQAKYSLEELRGMIIDEVKFYENMGGKARKNSGGSYAIPIHGPIDSFSATNSRKNSVSGSSLGGGDAMSSRSSWENMSGKSDILRDSEDGPISQMQTTRQQPLPGSSALAYPSSQAHRSYIPTDKLLDKLSALRLSNNSDTSAGSAPSAAPRPLPVPVSQMTTNATAYPGANVSSGIAGSDHRSYASSSPGRTPSTKAESPSLNKATKFQRSRVNSIGNGSNAVTPGSTAAATGSNYSNKSSLAAAGAAISMTNREPDHRPLDHQVNPRVVASSTARKSSDDFGSIFSIGNGKYHGFGAKIGTSANSSDDDLSVTSDHSIVERKVTTAPDNRHPPSSSASSIDQYQQNRMKSFLGLSSFGSSAKRF
jgi:serine/threonine protein kinase